MLSPGDARLVARETELPCLPLLLDPEAFVSWLQPRVPDVDIRGARARYLRYKPATSCLVAFDVLSDRGSVVITAKTFRAPGGDKLARVERFAQATSVLGPAVIVDPSRSLVACAFPFDVGIRSLRRVAQDGRSRVLASLLRDAGALRMLSYRPERRFVGVADTADGPVVIRVYSDAEYAAGAGRRLDADPHIARIARTLARHPRYPVTVTEWLEGADGGIALAEPDRARAIGEALAHLHGEARSTAWTRSIADEQRHVRAAARALADLLPAQAARLEHLAGALGTALLEVATSPVLTHGDFAARQVVFTARGVALTDLDEAAEGQAAGDLGSFLADLDVQAVSGGADLAVAARVAARFLDGYASVRGVPAGVDVHRAAHLIRLAVRPFRSRDVDWPERVGQIVDLCDENAWRGLVAGSATSRRCRAAASGAAEPASPFDVAMPWLCAALDPAHVRAQFAGLPWANANLQVLSARVLRHKPARRCLIEYRVGGVEFDTVLGKTRAKRVDTRTAEVTGALHAGAFNWSAADGLVVPAALGLVAPFRMWLQSAATGEPATAAIRLGSLDVARRLGEVPAKLQRHGPAPARTHTLVDELRTLDDRLFALAGRQPRLRTRLMRLHDSCRRAAATVEHAPLMPAHRDLHPDQILVDGHRLVVLDLDLYALAHPALDGGNCLAHVIELGLRPDADGGAVEASAEALRESVSRHLTAGARNALDVFTTLTLARLLDIDDRLEHRRACVAPLLELCEQRLAIAGVLAPDMTRVSGASRG